MNQRHISIGLNTICGFLILTQFNAWESIVLFVVGGVIPGTNQAMPAVVVLALIAIVFTTLITSLFIHFDTKSPDSLPKKRYSRV